MFLNPGLSTALDRIAERAADVRRAYTPGAVPAHDDVATAAMVSDFYARSARRRRAGRGLFRNGRRGGRESYTRDGSFALRGGRLVDGSGHPIFGARADGTLSVLASIRSTKPSAEFATPRSNATAASFTVGRTSIRAARRARCSGSWWVASRSRDFLQGRASSRPTAGISLHLQVSPSKRVEPTDGDFGALAPMHRERSRVDIDESLVRLKEAYFAFDASSSGRGRQGSPRQDRDGPPQMKSLGFSSPLRSGFGVSGRRLKEVRFESRSSSADSAACVVANGVRETLSSLLGLPVSMRLFEPSIPAPQAWPANLREARLYRVRGNITDAAIVLRRPMRARSRPRSSANRISPNAACALADRTRRHGSDGRCYRGEFRRRLRNPRRTRVERVVGDRRIRHLLRAARSKSR